MKSKPDISKLLDSIAASLESGTISRHTAAVSLRSIVSGAKSPVPKRRGRPVGSRTKAETPARKRAKEFFEFLDQGQTPRDAKCNVVKNHPGADTKTIYTEIRRHGPRIIEDGWDDLYFKIGRNFIEQHRDIAENLVAPMREFYPRLAARVRNLGNAPAAAAILKMPPLEESREFIEFVGKWLFDMSDDSGDAYVDICN